MKTLLLAMAAAGLLLCGCANHRYDRGYSGGAYDSYDRTYGHGEYQGYPNYGGRPDY